MRASDKTMNAQSMEGRLFGADFHDFSQNDPQNHSFEIASEFGLSGRDVRKLKKHLERS